MLEIALGTLEHPGGERARPKVGRLARRDLGGQLGDDPVARCEVVALAVGDGAAGQVLLADLDEATAVHGDEVPGGQDFDVDDGEDAVDDVVVVDLAGDALLADVVDSAVDDLVGDGW